MADDKILKWPGGQLDFSAGCLLMGILNVTPDSFSDGGEFFDFDKAVGHGVEMAEAGAAIIDVGPESSRPGAEAVGADEQIKRAVGVVEKLSAKTEAVISIDTRNAEVARAAVEAGAGMINDITALADDGMAELAADKGVAVVLMHMQGEPLTMQKEPAYGDVVSEVLDFLIGRAGRAERFGIAKEKIFIDPGIGFGKTIEHNLLLLRNIDKFIGSGYRVLVGASRKRFIGELTGKEKASDRMFGTAATVTLCAAAGVSILRVHDVGPMSDVLKITRATT